MRYYFCIKSWVKGKPTDKTNWYYYGWKKYLGCNVRDMDDCLLSDVKTYKSKKTAENIAKRIVEERKKAYDWMDYCYEILIYSE